MLALVCIFLGLMLFGLAQTKIIKNLEQSFYFNYDIDPVPYLVTTQCEAIQLTWERGVATGPNPQAPYSLQIYTSAFVFPFLVAAGSDLSFQWEVPFGPGTQYQVCMFDVSGNTGGCQAIHTVVAASSTPSCNNASFPLGPLDIDFQVYNGPGSQYGWIPQCTDIMLTPKNGTAPYIYTIAPADHPPYNITSDDNSSVNWTVSLTWATPFFISVVDADGNFWAYGPLHSGEGSYSCFQTAGSEGLSVGASVGIGIGGLVLGLLAGAGAAFVYYRHRLPSRTGHEDVDAMDLSDRFGSTSTRYRSLPSSGHALDTSGNSRYSLFGLDHHGEQYQVEPFVLPGNGATSPNNFYDRDSHQLDPVSPVARSEREPAHTGQIYVVHHDGGGAPVTVYHQDGAEVVELPPQYAEGSSTGAQSSNSSDRLRSPIEPSNLSHPFAQQRQPDKRPMKVREST